ncbi:porin [Opitutales bacterium]|nr:porin [Opitutales bacterium]
MKNKIIATLAAFGMVASASAVKINDNISINGFIDSSYNNYDETIGGAQQETTNTGIDEVELNFLVNAGNVSGELHIDNNGDADGSLDIEQAHFTYNFSNGAYVKVGKFGSNLGLEREDPAGLYTYSRAYGTFNPSRAANAGVVYNLGDVDGIYVGEGARFGYAAGDFSAALSLFNGVGALEEGPTLGVAGAPGENDYDYELSVSYTGIENLSVTAGVLNTSAVDSKPGNAADGADIDIYSVNAAYTLNKILIAGEYTSLEVDGLDDLSAYLLLLDYDINDKLGVAIRYSEWETAAATQSDKITFAPNYAITNSLGAIVEFSAEEASNGDEEDSIAVELTYTF